MTPEDYLQDYLNNKLSNEQKKRLENDPAFKMLLEEWQEVEQALNPNSKVNQFNQLSRKVIKKNRVHKRLKWWSFAAGITLVVSFVFWYEQRGGNDPLFDQYYEALYTSNVTRSNLQGNSVPVLFQTVDSLYGQKKYHQACALLRSWADESSFSPSSSYYFRLGELFLLTERPLMALENLEKIQYGYDENKKWLKAWAYYNSGQEELAQSIFEEIRDQQGSFGLLASEVLGRMNK